MKRRIYVASSWKNHLQKDVVAALRGVGFDVYDYRDPENPHFHWSHLGENWQYWSATQFQEALKKPVATAAYRSDINALKACDTCVMVLPCGKSAHLEAGWAAGAGRRLFILLDATPEPELMYGMAEATVTSIEELLAIIGQP